MSRRWSAGHRPPPRRPPPAQLLWRRGLLAAIPRGGLAAFGWGGAIGTPEVDDTGTKAASGGRGATRAGRARRNASVYARPSPSGVGTNQMNAGFVSFSSGRRLTDGRPTNGFSSARS